MKQTNAGLEATENSSKSANSALQMVPFANVDSLKILKNPGTWLILVFAFAVLPINQSVPSNQDLLTFVVAYSALAWAAYFYVFVAKRATNLWLGLATAVFTIVIGVPFGRLLKHTVLSPLYSMNTSSIDIVRLIGTLGSDGLAEESLKALPLVLLALLLKQMKRPIDGVFYGALSGLGFAAWEGYRYISSPDAGGILMDALVRSTALPFLHAAYTGISGYFIAFAPRSRRPVMLCVLGVAIASAIHGCYDFLTNTPRLVMAIIVYLLFTAYVDMSQFPQIDVRPQAQLGTPEASQAASG